MLDEFVNAISDKDTSKLWCVGCNGRCKDIFEVIKKITNLRGVLVLSWIGIGVVMEAMQDKYLCSLKPNPAVLVLVKKIIN